METRPIYFASSSAFRSWLEAHHDQALELWVGFHKRDSGKPSMSWSESVDVALCFGWIDGVRKSVDETSYKIRFTPRKASSRWSTVNIRKVQELTRLGLMNEAGSKAFEQRTPERSSSYSYEQRHLIELEESQTKLFRRSKKAWHFFHRQPNWYRKAALWWVVSAKREETRLKRLTQLIADSEQGRTIAPLTRTKKPTAAD